ncbi:MAG: hypothetical protein IKO27_00180 [Ruminococcus sp.]|nr:hypothetical protein [Ruminococcus sp.]
MQFKNDKLNIFFRRYGHYFTAGIMLSVLVALIIIGRTTSAEMDIQARYISQSKVQEEYDKQMERYESILSDDNIWDYTYELDKLGLSYEPHISGRDGNTLTYTARFDRSVNEKTVEEIKEQIEKKCGKLAEDNNYGKTTVKLTGDRTIEILLDLSSATDLKAVTGIFKALDSIEGIEGAEAVIK